MPSPGGNDKDVNHTVSEPYNDRTDLNLIQIAYNCNPDPVTKNVYNYWIS